MKYKLVKPEIKKLHFDIEIPVYDITVADDHSYCVGKNNTIVHNCRTRQYTGFGSPAITTLQECAQAAKNIQIIADGGLTVVNDEVWIGDIAKAIRFGADFVMSGALFSRCVDSPAMINGYYGNASQSAKGHRKHVEGTTLDVKTNGLTIEQQMNLIEDSLRSSVSYAGGKDLNALRTVDYYIVNDQ